MGMWDVETQRYRDMGMRDKGTMGSVRTGDIGTWGPWGSKDARTQGDMGHGDIGTQGYKDMEIWGMGKWKLGCGDVGHGRNGDKGTWEYTEMGDKGRCWDI